MTTVSTAVPAAEVTEIDSGARATLGLLLASALKWLVLGGVLQLLELAQLTSPSLLADCAWLTHGRLHALAQNAIVYGWCANAGFAVALWILGRLGGEPLRAQNWSRAGVVAWNLGLTAGLIGIVAGDGASLAWLQLPRYVLPLLAFAAAAIALPGVLAWTGRRHATAFAAQWYAVAALFLFPWLFTAAQMMLVFFPVRGVLQAVVDGWFVQGAWTLWLAPLALSAAYYLVPKITGRVLPNYATFAALSFWTLLVIGGWTGGRNLVGGPAPAWIATMAVVCCALLAFHYIIVLLNLRGAFGSASGSLKFVAFGLAAYVVGGALDAVTAMRGVAQVVQFTHFATAQMQLALLGAFSMTVFGAIYFLLPRLTGQAWPSGALIRAHYLANVIGVVGLVGSLAVAGWTQGHELGDPAATFASIAAHTRSWLLVAAAAQALLVLGNLCLLVNFARAVCLACPGCGAAPAENPFRPAPAMETPAS